MRTSILVVSLAIAIAPCFELFGLEPSSSVNSFPDDHDVKRIVGKWTVISMTFDGPHSGAQIGQKPGDVITVELAEDNQALAFS